MRFIAILVAGLMFGACATNSYRIPPQELARIAQTPPETRGSHVRVIQEIGSGTETSDAQRVGPDTQIIFVPQINIYSGPRYDRHQHANVGGGGGLKGGSIKGGSGSDGKAAAIAILILAAVALFAVAGVEGSRFDGYAQLHPMYPVHLIGKDGGYTVMPLAWIDSNAAAWTDKAIVKSNEGPWHQLERAPLDRQGGTYGMYGGTGTLRSADGSNGAGPAFTVQAGYFFNQQIGILADLMFAWRNNAENNVLFESRYMLELQVMPVHAGIFHAGGYFAGGLAYRHEDNVMKTGNNGSEAYSAGAQLQLDINTRIGLTARMGVTKAHEASGFGNVDRMTDLIFGLAVY